MYITMGNDYFKTVNTLEKVKNLHNKLSEDTTLNPSIVHLPNQYHMPNFKDDLEDLIVELEDLSNELG